MSYEIFSGTLGSAVADDGTFTLSYTAGTDEGEFALSAAHTAVIDQRTLTAPADFTLTFGATNITVTNKSGASWPAEAKYYVQAEKSGDKEFVDSNGTQIKRIGGTNLVTLQLGAPDTADADGVCASQAINTDGALDGALVSGGVATFDVPRNVVAAWTTTATLTVTGTDEYGNTITETSGSGTSMAGKKAFKTVTAVSSSTAITGATVGTGDVLGLPVAIPSTGVVLAELENGAAVGTPGTVVAADVTAGGATATTGDVRGTYDPNSAANGDKYFTLVVALTDLNLGTTQA